MLSSAEQENSFITSGPGKLKINGYTVRGNNLVIFILATSVQTLSFKSRAKMKCLCCSGKQTGSYRKYFLL